jgi:hypothetical protein
MTADRADEAQLEGSDTLTRQIAVAGLLAGIASALFAGLLDDCCTKRRTL